MLAYWDGLLWAQEQCKLRRTPEGRTRRPARDAPPKERTMRDDRRRAARAEGGARPRVAARTSTRHVERTDLCESEDVEIVRSDLGHNFPRNLGEKNKEGGPRPALEFHHYRRVGRPRERHVAPGDGVGVGDGPAQRGGSCVVSRVRRTIRASRFDASLSTRRRRFRFSNTRARVSRPPRPEASVELRACSHGHHDSLRVRRGGRARARARRRVPRG